MRKPHEIFDAYRRGDRLADDELHSLGWDMAQIAGITAKYGDLFGLSYCYARMVEQDCRKFLAARQTMREKEAARAPRTH